MNKRRKIKASIIIILLLLIAIIGLIIFFTYKYLTKEEKENIKESEETKEDIEVE